MTPHNLQCYADGNIADMDIDNLTYDEFAALFLSIKDKYSKTIPFIKNRTQIDFAKKKRESGKKKFIIVKARQEGFSTDIIGDQFIDAITEENTCVIVGCDNKNTAKLRRILKRFYDKLPKTLKVKKSIDNALTTIYSSHDNDGNILFDSEFTIDTAGGKASGRGGTCNKFHGSEVAFWPDPDITISGALQSLAPDGECVMESTANGAQGWLWEMVNNPGDDWCVLFYAWWWAEEYQIELLPDEIIDYTEDELKSIEIARADGFELTPEQIKWRRNKQSQKGLKFTQEYPETLKGAFITSGKSVFIGYEDSLYGDCIEYSDGNNRDEFIITSEYDPTHIYVAGIDWGQSDDYTGISVNDVTDGKEVYLDRFNKEDWGVMIDKLVSVCVKFRTKLVQPEYNSMSMQVNEFEEKIVAEYTKYNEERDKDTPEWYCTIEAYTMTNKRKDDLVGNFYTAIKYSGYQLLDIEYANSEMATFVTTQSKAGAYIYGAIPGGHDDTVIMRMLALNAAQGMNY